MAKSKTGKAAVTPKPKKPRAPKAPPPAPPIEHESGRYGKARMRGYLPEPAPADAADSEGGEL